MTITTYLYEIHTVLITGPKHTGQPPGLFRVIQHLKNMLSEREREREIKNERERETW
jgi:hypothetical protein